MHCQNSYTEISQTYLVVDLVGRVGQRDGLFKDMTGLGQFLALRPVVECAGNVDIGRWVFPMVQENDISFCSRYSATAVFAPNSEYEFLLPIEKLWSVATESLPRGSKVHKIFLVDSEVKAL